MAGSKLPFGIGEYPAEFNPKVHGPYDPARFYGKPDTPFSQVKLGEMLQWLSRRSYNPVDIGRGLGRGWWRYSKAWLQPKKAGVAGVIQLCMGVSLYYYVAQYPGLTVGAAAGYTLGYPFHERSANVRVTDVSEAELNCEWKFLQRLPGYFSSREEMMVLAVDPGKLSICFRYLQRLFVTFKPVSRSLGRNSL